MRRIGIGFLLTALLSTGAATAQGTYSPPPVGAQITWSVPTETGSQTRVSEVVASGPDFAIYLYDLKDSENPWSYFVEFSGLHMSACSARMPTGEERAQLSALWPLQPGAEAKVTSAGPEIVYKIKEQKPYAVSQMDGDESSQLVTKIIGDLETEVTVSLGWKMPVREEWADGRADSVIDVFAPAAPRAPEDGRKLGNCRALLQ